jgi:hypothetical protein
MIPAVDDRLLPDFAAADSENIWFYNGGLEGLRAPRTVLNPTTAGTRSVFRVPKGSTAIDAIDNSYWLQFPATDISVVKNPVAEQSDPAYYWADGINAPGYTTMSRLAAGDPALVLGMPTPATAPTVAPAGGVSTTNETRSYVYTWLSQWGEEGPPSPPTTVTGKIDDTWAIGLTAPTPLDNTGRVITHVNIYRTVTGSDGTATFWFVAQLAIATLNYNDTISDDTLVAGGQLESTDYTPPPAGLQGLAVMPNGMLCGWLDNEIWFSEPYLPHAWPAKYQISTEYPIVAMVAAGQTLIIATQGFPYYATGVNPGAVSLQRIPDAEPCLSRGSMVGTQFGAYYASPNGLMFVSAVGTIQNLTRDTISKQEWETLLNLKELRAALLNGAYFVYCGVQEAAFESTAFDNASFQMLDDNGTRAGALIELTEQRVGFCRLLADTTVYNVLTDVWTGEVLLVRESTVDLQDLTNPVMQDYTWTSKIFSIPYPDNLAAVKITYDPPVQGSPTGTFTTFADGVQRQQRAIPASDEIFRLPSGYKANSYQFVFSGNVVIKSIQIATSIKEMQQV